MSRTTIYRCDICCDESTNANDWCKDVEVFARWGNDAARSICFDHGKRFDICPKCQERIKDEFRQAWRSVKEARR